MRIQILLPLFALSSWLALYDSKANYIIEPVREIYEAFTIYTFFTLLTNILGGERSIITAASGRAPKPLLFPLNHLTSNKVDISDPLTFLYIKRGILQYVWMKPFISLCNLILKISTEEGTTEHSTAKVVVVLIYNFSVSLSLYSLALFWYCLLDDLSPYRPFPKFLCIKAVIFFSFWQSVGISILSAIGVQLPTHTQSALMCLEMLPLALAHWSAFSYKDYATADMIGFARLPFMYAVRDAFGTVDLMKDFRSTFYGREYGYRQFDSVESVLDHPESASRQARIMAGLRYGQGGKSRYWIPESTIRSRDFLSRLETSSSSPSPPLPDSSATSSLSRSGSVRSQESAPNERSALLGSVSEEQYSTCDPEDELIYEEARKLPYGDYNYPVITVRESVPYVPVAKRHSSLILRDPDLQEQYDSFGREEGDESLLDMPDTEATASTKK